MHYEWVNEGSKSVEGLPTFEIRLRIRQKSREFNIAQKERSARKDRWGQSEYMNQSWKASCFSNISGSLARSGQAGWISMENTSRSHICPRTFRKLKSERREQMVARRDYDNEWLDQKERARTREIRSCTLPSFVPPFIPRTIEKHTLSQILNDSSSVSMSHEMVTKEQRWVIHDWGFRKREPHLRTKNKY